MSNGKTSIWKISNERIWFEKYQMENIDSIAISVFVQNGQACLGK